ncbi:hypothetical protein AAFP30_28125 [Gordonia sp. CPCC 205515]|uniref:hypothetical protein n=1 Tax=Gordonia sp. CPCC 205515 TaxID=3140791 RepID=UPI003AF3E996
MTLVRVVVVLLAMGGLFLIAPGTACACTCVPRPAAAVVKDASAIVVGTPVSREVDGTAVRYRFEVRDSYKARVPQTITVLTSSNSAACGLELELDKERMLVLGHTPGGLAAADGEWGASLCDNTAIGLDDAVEYAGANIPPYTAESERSPAPTVIAVFVAIAALIAIPGGIVWWRVRARARHPHPLD